MLLRHSVLPACGQANKHSYWRQAKVLTQIYRVGYRSRDKAKSPFEKVPFYKKFSKFTSLHVNYFHLIRWRILEFWKLVYSLMLRSSPKLDLASSIWILNSTNSFYQPDPLPMKPSKAASRHIQTFMVLQIASSSPISLQFKHPKRWVHERSPRKANVVSHLSAQSATVSTLG